MSRLFYRLLPVVVAALALSACGEDPFETPTNPNPAVPVTETFNESEAEHAAGLACLGSETRTNKGTLRLDHPYGSGELGSGGNEGVVRQGARLDVQAKLPDAGRRRISPLCVL